MIGLGIETAIELANAQNDEGRDELIAKLEAVHALSKSTMWELRHPIDAGPIFEGREFGRVLRSHASTFTSITSIPTGVEQSGREPRLSTVTRGMLFSIAHNAMTNAFRHSRAGRVATTLSFDGDGLRNPRNGAVESGHRSEEVDRAGKGDTHALCLGAVLRADS